MNGKLSLTLETFVSAQENLKAGLTPTQPEFEGIKSRSPRKTRAWAEYVRQMRVLGYEVEYGVLTDTKGDERTVMPKE